MVTTNARSSTPDAQRFHFAALGPAPATCELTLTILHPGVTIEQVREATGWELRAAERVEVGAPPTREDLEALRALKTFDGGAG